MFSDCGVMGRSCRGLGEDRMSHSGTSLPLLVSARDAAECLDSTRSARRKSAPADPSPCYPPRAWQRAPFGECGPADRLNSPDGAGDPVPAAARMISVARHRNQRRTGVGPVTTPLTLLTPGILERWCRCRRSDDAVRPLLPTRTWTLDTRRGEFQRCAAPVSARRFGQVARTFAARHHLFRETNGVR